MPSKQARQRLSFAMFVALAQAIEHAKAQLGPATRVLMMSPQGERMSQDWFERLSREAGLVVLCGRYEGLDERVLDAHGLDEISLGDFVLSGGEAAAIAVIDACVRLLPGVVGAPESLIDESFENGLLEYPQYTRPREWRGRTVPEVLVSGDHEKIKAWRRHQAEAITRERRPDLWARYAGGDG